MKSIKNMKKAFIPILMIAIIMIGVMVSGTKVSASDITECQACREIYVNGFCSCEGAAGYQPVADSDNDKYYEISNAGQLYYYGEMLNDSENMHMNVILTNDIVVNVQVLDNGKLIEDTSALREWIPMGSEIWYKGHFEGNGHTISGLYVASDTSDIGLFARADAKITNLGIIDSYFGAPGASRVGAIVGYADIVTIENCYSTAVIYNDEDDADVGGLFATITSSSVIKNCYFGGKILCDSSTYVGAIAGDNRCENIQNCYYLSDCGAEFEDATALTEDEMKNGYLAYNLNKTRGENAEWYQTVGEDYPAFNGDKVYASEPCPIKFTNDSEAVESIQHDFALSSGYDGIGHWSSVCDNCGDREDFTQHNYDENGACADCEFKHLFKIESPDGSVEYYTNFNSISYKFDELESGTVIYLLQDITVSHTVSILPQSLSTTIDLNGYDFSGYIYWYGNARVFLTDSSYGNTGSFKGKIFRYNYSPLHSLIIKDCVLGLDVTLFAQHENGIVIDDATIYDTDFYYSDTTKENIKVKNATFVNGFSSADNDVADFLTETGYIVDAEGNEITLTEGQKSIDETFTVRTDTVAVTVGGETKNYTNIVEAFESIADGTSARVTLLANIENYGITQAAYPSNAEITFDFAGNSVSDTVFVISSPLFTIEDNSENKSGALNSIPRVSILSIMGGNVVMNGGTLYRNIFLMDGATFTVNGGTINDGGITINDGALTINGGDFNGGFLLDISEEPEAVASATLLGGRYTSLEVRGATLADVIGENYIPLLKEDIYFIDFTKSNIDNSFTLVEHTHEYHITSYETTHRYECVCGLVDSESPEEEHYGGTATCEDAKICEACESYYGESLGHSYGDFTSLGNDTHARTCANDPTHVETENCYTETANEICGQKSVCDECEAEYGEALAHDFSGYYIPSNGQHYLDCQRSGCDATSEPEDCVPGDDPTCIDPQTCTVCYAVLADANGHTEGTPATCEEPAICASCEEYYGRELGHDYVSGVCLNCSATLAFKVVFDSFGAFYTDDIVSLLQVSGEYADSIEITLLKNTAYGGTSVILTSGNVTIDLAGHTLDGLIILNAGADITITDSSEEKTGVYTSGEQSKPIMMVAYGSLTINGGNIVGTFVGYDNDIIEATLTINGGTFNAAFTGYVEINGGVFENVIFASTSENKSIFVNGGTFKKVIVMSEEGTLADVFTAASCISYVDGEGNPVTVDLTAVDYDGEFSVVHDDSHTSRDSYVSDYYNHWYACETGVTVEKVAHTFGEGAACTVCEATAPFVVEVGGKKFGFSKSTDAFDFAIDSKDAKITLYDNAMIVENALHPIGYEAMGINGVNLTIDLNGNALQFSVSSYEIYSSTLTIEDNSEGKSGVLYLSCSEAIDVLNSVLTFKNITIVNEVYADLEYSYVLLDGVTFENYFNIYVYYSAVAVKSATFKDGAYVYSYNGLQLNDFFGTDCMVAVDENGEAIVFEGYIYYDAFTLTHDDSHFGKIVVSGGNGIHWTMCDYCSMRGEVEICSGGEATCDSGAVCEICKTEYTDAINHSYDENGACEFCDKLALAEVNDGINSWYFDSVYEAFYKASQLEIATIIMHGNHFNDSYAEIYIYRGNITLDLNGYGVNLYSLEINGGILKITDNSKNKNGFFNVYDDIRVYGGELIFNGGNYVYISVDLDGDYDELKVTVNGGQFEEFYLESDYNDYFMAFEINGGTFESLTVYIYDYLDLIIRGGEFGYVYISGSYADYIGSYFAYDCIIAITETAERVHFGEYEYGYYNYFKVIHDDSALENALVSFDSDYHWLACDCGKISGVKEEHKGESAACGDYAVCEVCSAEYGLPGGHDYDDERVCENCGHEANGNIKVVIDGIVEYTDSIELAFEVSYYSDNVLVTLLDDVSVYEDEIVVYKSKNFTLDLNGYTLYAYGIYVYDANLTIVDSSENKSGALYTDQIDIYAGKLVIKSGKFDNLYVMLDDELGRADLVIEGGSFKSLNVADSSRMIAKALSVGNMRPEIYIENDVNMNVTISGGKFKSLTFVIYTALNVSLTGGEYQDGIAVMDRSGNGYGLIDLLDADCYGFYTDNGDKAEKLSKKVMLLGSFKVLHVDSYELKIDENTHYYECLCGDVKDVEEHIYDNDCDADCNVCEAERVPAEHIYDNDCDANCNVCEDERVPAEHIYDNACDTTCNVCSDEREVEDHVYDNACDVICNVCGDEKAPVEHSYTDACDAICNECGNIRVPAEHIYDNVCDADCNVCGKTRTSAEHNYTNACDADCNACGAARTPADHNYSNACDTNCNVCGNVRTVADHVYTNACDTDCNVCANVRTVADHVYTNACDANCNVCGNERTPTAHVYTNNCDATCNVCEDERVPADHVYTNNCDATCNVCEAERDPADHVYTNNCDAICNVCEGERVPADHVYTNNCDAICNVCEAERDPADHVYTNNCDATCNVCEGERVPADHVYTNNCDATCNVCEAERVPADHVYTNNCDATCNVCEDERVPADHVYTNACDAICNVCEAERVPADHVYTNACDANCNVCGNERTPTAHAYTNNCDANCNVCGNERTPTAHVYTNNCDATCNVCGVARTPVAHTFGDTETVTEPTKKNAGEGKMTCSECGHVENVVIPEVEGMTAGAITTVTIASTVAVLTGAFALFWFVIKKKAFADFLSIFK